MITYIIGHQKPDTDAIVASIAFKHLFDSSQRWGHSKSIACITHNLNPETKFIFDKFSTPAPKIIKASQINPKDKIVLVDHNEQTQRLKGLNPDQITDIFDHHKINLNLNHPIFVTFKSWGSTTTIAWHLMLLYKVKIPKTLASLMLSAIISDTTGFKSSTTTSTDKQAAKDLQIKAQINNLDKLILDIFKAKSNLSKLTNNQIVQNDYKIYNFGKKTYIAQLETIEQDSLINTQKKNLLQAMETVKSQKKLDLIFLAISDIISVNTKILILSDAEAQVVKKAFNKPIHNQLIDIGPKLSRKKDIAPAIEKALK